MIYLILYILFLIFPFIESQKCSAVNEYNMICHENPIQGYKRSTKYNYFITHEQQGSIIAWDYNQNSPLKQRDIGQANIQFTKVFDSDDCFMAYSSDGQVSFHNLWDLSSKNTTKMSSYNQQPLGYLASKGYLVHLNILTYHSVWKESLVQEIILDLQKIYTQDKSIIILDTEGLLKDPLFFVSTGQIYEISLYYQKHTLLTTLNLSPNEYIKEAKHLNGDQIYILTTFGKVFAYQTGSTQNAVELNLKFDQNDAQIIQRLLKSYQEEEQKNVQNIYFIGQTKIYQVNINSPRVVKSYTEFNSQNTNIIKFIDIYQESIIFISDSYEIYLFQNKILKRNSNFIYPKKNNIHFTSIDTQDYAVYFDDPSIGLIVFATNDMISKIYSCFSNQINENIVYGETFPTLTTQLQFQYGSFYYYDNSNKLIVKYYRNNLSLFSIIQRDYLFYNKFTNLVNIQLNQQYNLITAAILAENTYLSIDYFTGRTITRYKFTCSINEIIPFTSKPATLITNYKQKPSDSDCSIRIGIVNLQTYNLQQIDSQLVELKQRQLLRVGISEQQQVSVGGNIVTRDVLILGTDQSLIMYLCNWDYNISQQLDQYACSYQLNIAHGNQVNATQIEFDTGNKLAFAYISSSNSIIVYQLDTSVIKILKQYICSFTVHSFTIIQQSYSLIFFTQPPRSSIKPVQNVYILFYQRITDNKEFDGIQQIYSLDGNYKKTIQFYCLTFAGCLRGSLIVQSDGMFYSVNYSLALSLFGNVSPLKEEDKITEMVTSSFDNILFYAQKSNKLKIIFDTSQKVTNFEYEIPTNIEKMVELDSQHIMALTQNNQEITLQYQGTRNIFSLKYTPDFKITGFTQIDSFVSFFQDEEQQSTSVEFQNSWIAGTSSTNAQQIAYIENFQVKINNGFNFKGTLQRVMKFNDFILVITYLSTSPSWNTSLYFLQVKVDSVTQMSQLLQVAKYEGLSLATDVVYDNITQRLFFFGSNRAGNQQYIYYILLQDIQKVLAGELVATQLPYKYIGSEVLSYMKLNQISLYFYKYSDEERSLMQLQKDESSSIFIIITQRELITVAQKTDPNSTKLFRVLNFYNSEFNILKTFISIPLKALIILPSNYRFLELRSIIRQNIAIRSDSKNIIFFQFVYFVDETNHTRLISCGGTQNCQYFKLEKINNKSITAIATTLSDTTSQDDSTAKFSDSTISISSQSTNEITQLTLEQGLKLTQILTYTQSITLISVQTISSKNIFIEASVEQYNISIRDYETGRLIRQMAISNKPVMLMYNKYLDNLQILCTDSVLFLDTSEITTLNSNTVTESLVVPYNIVKYFHDIPSSSQPNKSFQYLVGSQNGLIFNRDFEKDIFQVEFTMGSEIIGSLKFNNEKYFFSNEVLVKVTQDSNSNNIYKKYPNIQHQSFKILKDTQNNIQYLIGISYPSSIKIYKGSGDNIVLVSEHNLQNNILDICKKDQIYENLLIQADVKGNLYVVHIDNQNGIVYTSTSIINDPNQSILEAIYDKELNIVIVYDSLRIISFYSLLSDYTLSKIAKYSYTQNQFNKRIFYDQLNHILIYRKEKFPQFVAVKIEGMDSHKEIATIPMLNFSKESPLLTINTLVDGKQYLLIYLQNYIQIHNYINSVNSNQDFSLILGIQYSTHILSSASILQHPIQNQLLLILTYENSLQIYSFSKTLSNFIHTNMTSSDQSPTLLFSKSFSNPKLLAFYLNQIQYTSKGSIQESSNLVLLGYSLTSFFKFDLLINDSSTSKSLNSCQIDIYQTSYLSLQNIFQMYQASLSSLANSQLLKYEITIYMQKSHQLMIIPDLPNFNSYSFLIKGIENSNGFSMTDPPIISLVLSNILTKSISKLKSVKFSQLNFEIDSYDVNKLEFSNQLKSIEFYECFWSIIPTQSKESSSNTVLLESVYVDSSETKSQDYVFKSVPSRVNFYNVTNIVMQRNGIYLSNIQEPIFQVQGKNSQIKISDSNFQNNTLYSVSLLTVREDVSVVLENVIVDGNIIIQSQSSKAGSKFPPIFLFLGAYKLNSTNVNIKNNKMILSSGLTIDESQSTIPQFIYAIQCYACEFSYLTLTNFTNNQNILLIHQNQQYKIFIEEQKILINIKISLPKFIGQSITVNNNQLSSNFSEIITEEYEGLINLENIDVVIKGSFFKQNQYVNQVNLSQLSSFTKKMCSVITMRDSNSISIQSSEFYKNSMINGGALIIQKCKNKMDIQSNHFIENYALLNGGAIFMKNYINTLDFSLIQNVFNKNTAQISGGALHLESSSIRIKDNIFQNNTALIVGGGIRYLGIVPEFIKEQSINNRRNLEVANIEYGKDRFNNTIINNKARIFGNNLGSYSRYLSMIHNFTRVNKDQSVSYQISQIQSGYGIQGLNIYLHDEEGNKIDLTSLTEQDLQLAQIDQVIQEIINSKAQSVISQNSKSILELEDITEVSYSKKSYNFSSMQVTGIPGNEHSSYIEIKNIPIYSSFLNDSQSYMNFSSQVVQIQLDFRDCQKGEIYSSLTRNTLSKCTPCPQGKYQLVDPKYLSSVEQVCLPCPLEKATQCHSNYIQLKQGYWRKNNETDEIIQCMKDTLVCNGDPSTNYCSEGRIGPLCETCDILGTTWNESYFRSSIKTCSKCHSFDVHAYINFFLLLLVFIYSLIVVRGIIRKAESQIFTTYLRKTGLFVAGSSAEADKSTIYTKMLISYLFISSSFYSFNVFFPLQLINLSFSVGDPVKISYFSFDCLLKNLKFSLPLPYMRIIIVQLSPIFFFILIMLILVIIQSFYYKRKFHKKYLFATLSTIFILFHGSISQSLFELISCRLIGSEKYVQVNLANYCYDNDHRLYSIAMGLPLIIVWIVIIPLAIFFSMRSQRFNLDSLQNLYRFGSITQEYKKKIYYWEIVRIYLRVIISFFLSFFLSNSMYKGVSIMAVLLFYWIMVNRLQPYIQISLNRIDKNTCMIEMIIVVSCTMVENTSFEALKIVFSLIVYFLHAYQTIYLIYLIINSYYAKNLAILTNIAQKVINRVSCLFSKKLRESVKSSSYIRRYNRFKHWQFLRINVHQAIILRKTNSKHKMLSAQTVRISQVDHVRKIRSQLNVLMSNNDYSKSRSLIFNIDRSLHRDNSAQMTPLQYFEDLKIKKLQSIVQDRNGSLNQNNSPMKFQNSKSYTNYQSRINQSRVTKPLNNITDVSSSNTSNNNIGDFFNDQSCFINESQLNINNSQRINQTREVNNNLQSTVRSIPVTVPTSVRPLNVISLKQEIVDAINSNLNFSFIENKDDDQHTPITLQTLGINTAGNLTTTANLNYQQSLADDQVFITQNDLEGNINSDLSKYGIEMILYNRKHFSNQNKEKQE